MKNKKNIIVLTILLLAILGLTVFFIPKKAAAPGVISLNRQVNYKAPVIPIIPRSKAEILIKNNNFSVKTIEIKVGEALTITNTDNIDHQIRKKGTDATSTLKAKSSQKAIFNRSEILEFEIPQTGESLVITVK